MEKWRKQIFGFDGSKVVLPFRTNRSFLETNPNTSNDMAYAVINSDLSINKMVHLGQQTFNVWRAINFPTGTINGDNQLRSVVVLGPDDYLFTGKTSLRIADFRTQFYDVIMVRYINNQLHSIKQFGDTVLPDGTANEEVRHMYKDGEGNIYIHGHSASAIFGSTSYNLSPTVMKVDSEGNLISGFKLRQDLIDVNVVNLTHETISNEMLVTEDELIFTFNHAPDTVNVTKSFLWVMEKF